MKDYDIDWFSPGVAFHYGQYIEDRKLMEKTRDSKEEEKMDVSKMTKEEALKRIEELKESFELANLIYVRNYLGVKIENIWEARTKMSTVFCVRYHPGENEYGIIEIQPLMALRPHELIWCFTDNLEAQRVCDYMNKYVAHIKRQMF